MDWEVAGKDKGKGTASDAASPQKPPQRKGRKMKTWAIVVLVIVVLAIAGKITSCAKDQPSDLDWPTTGLAKMLPEPPTKKGEANTNSAEQLDADIEDCTESQFKDYVESCKDKGFTVDAIEDTDSYTAYTEKSYKLDLCYYGSMEEMSITLDAPIEMGDIAWPTSGSGSYAPAPVSTKGKITSESSDYFTAYVGDTDKAAYSAYVDSCIAAGYNVDYSKGDTSFYADRADGAYINVSFEGFNTMKAYVDLTDLKETAADSSADEAAAQADTSAEAAASTDTAVSDTSTSDADFRQFVDDYESFMNGYCDFMEKYNNSTDTTSMLVDYAKWTAQYTEWAAKYDDYDTSNVSADDLAYYTAAQARIAERLSKIQ